MSHDRTSRRQFLKEAALLVGAAYPLAAWNPQASFLSHTQPAAKWNVEGPGPHLFIHYVAWFTVQKSATDPTRVWTHWKWTAPHANHNPENRLANGLRDIASVGYPLIGPYSSWSSAVARYHLATAKAAGARGFIMDWNGPGSTEDDNIPIFLDEAHKLGMKIALLYEEKINFVWPGYRNLKTRADLVPAVVSDFKGVLNKYASHPAYLRRNGRPLLLQFNGYGTGRLGPQYLLPEEWVQVMQQLPEPISYARQGLDPAYANTTPGRYLWYSSNYAGDIGYNAQARQMVNRRQAEFFVSMMCPRFDDEGVWGWGGGPRITPPEGLSLLKSTFDHALVDGPELIQVVTWNDFNEGTFVEPSRENGFQYLDALATWWGSKFGYKPDLHAIRAPFLEYAKTCSAEQRAELPARPFDTYLARRPLNVAVPHYLEVLAAAQAHKS